MRIPALFFLGCLMTHTVCAADLFGTVDAVSGGATVSDADGTSLPVTSGLKVFTGQSIQTAADGEVHIVTEDSGLIALRPNSSFRIDRYQAGGESSNEIVFSLFKGALRSITGWIAKRNPSAYRLNTPNATIGVRGTDHETTVIEISSGNDQPGTFDTVLEGATVMQTNHGYIEVHPGEHAFAARDSGIAPKLLSRHPDFRNHRSLRIEERIQVRKENLTQRLLHRGGEKMEGLNGIPAGQKTENVKPRNFVKPHSEQRRPRNHRAP